LHSNNLNKYHMWKTLECETRGVWADNDVPVVALHRPESDGGGLHSAGREQKLKPMSLMVFLCELSGMLRLELRGAHLDELLCLGQAALGDGNIQAGCFDSVTIKNGAVDLFLILVGWFSFH
jgi:hypothetical protein